jgi:hypothetical protein
MLELLVAQILSSTLQTICIIGKSRGGSNNIDIQSNNISEIPLQLYWLVLDTSVSILMASEVYDYVLL